MCDSEIDTESDHFGHRFVVIYEYGAHIVFWQIMFFIIKNNKIDKQLQLVTRSHKVK